jgi:hypothetical protein
VTGVLDDQRTLCTVRHEQGALRPVNEIGNLLAAEAKIPDQLEPTFCPNALHGRSDSVRRTKTGSVQTENEHGMGKHYSATRFLSLKRR